jgi:hypothetical protein
VNGRGQITFERSCDLDGLIDIFIADQQ